MNTSRRCSAAFRAVCVIICLLPAPGSVPSPNVDHYPMVGLTVLREDGVGGYLSQVETNGRLASHIIRSPCGSILCHGSARKHSNPEVDFRIRHGSGLGGHVNALAGTDWCLRIEDHDA